MYEIQNVLNLTPTADGGDNIDQGFEKIKLEQQCHYDAINELDTAKAPQSTTYTKTETDDLLTAKANQSTTYTKTETNNLLTAKANQSTTYTKTEADTLLTDKANQVTTYTKTETDYVINEAVDIVIKQSSISYATQALLYADLSRVEDTTGFVYNDTTDTKNGLYIKQGASGAGSWLQIPYIFTEGKCGLLFGAKITINRQAGTMVVSGATYITHGTSYKQLPIGTVTLPANPSNVPMYYYYDLNTNAINAKIAPNAMPKNNIVFALDIADILSTPSDGVVDYINRNGVTILASNVKNGVIVTGSITINRSTNQIVVGITTAIGHDNKYDTIPAATVAISATNPTSLRTYYFDRTANTVGVVTAPSVVPENAIVFAYDDGTQLIGPDLTRITYINSVGVSVNTINAIIGTVIYGQLTIKRNTNQIITAGVYIGAGNSYYAVSDATVSISATSPTSLRTFYFDRTTNAMTVAVAPATVPANAIVIAYDFGGKIFAPDMTCIKYVDVNGNTLGGFTPTLQRLLLPPSMYFISGTPLPLYKSSVISDLDTNILDKLKATLMPNKAGESPYQYFIEDILLDDTKLGSTFDIGFKQNYLADYRYKRAITKEVAAASVLSGETINILMFGDSLTEVDAPGRLKTVLTALGATVTTYGTYLSTAPATEYRTWAEGRGFWSYRNFIGKDNGTEDSITPSISLPSGTGVTTKFENPFLKLATADDKTNHPTWCFRFTSTAGTPVDRELSYQDDADKTGNFYIFDFAHYLTTHASAHLANDIDIITIGLSTNDIQLDPAASPGYASDWLDFTLLGLEIMLSQIKAALPNVKIGIIPSPGFSSTDFGNTENMRVATWIENCEKKISDLGLSGVYIVPVWAHMNCDWNYPTTDSDLSSVNFSKSCLVNDKVHFGDVGKQQYVDVVTAWIANMFK